MNDTHREKLVFFSVQYKNGCLAAFDLSHMFTQSIKFYKFHYHALKVQMFQKCESMVGPFSKLYGKIWVGFCHNTGKHCYNAFS